MHPPVDSPRGSRRPASPGGATVWHVHVPSALLPFQRQAQFDLGGDPEAEFRRLADLQCRYRLARERLRLYPVPDGTVGQYGRVLHSVLTLQPIDVAFLAMAASDYEPEPASGKITSDAEELTITCRPTEKVIRKVRDWSPEVFLVGFKLLSHVEEPELIRRAETACVANRADATVANDYRSVHEGTHRIHLVRPGVPAESIGPGDDMAEHLVDRVFAMVRHRMGSREPIDLDSPE